MSWVGGTMDTTMRVLTDFELEHLGIFRRTRRRWVYWGDLGLPLRTVEELVADGWLRWRDPRNQYRVTLDRLIEPDGIALAAFEIDPPRLVPCLDVPNQIAQKVHACTEPLPGGNDRVRDIVDIWLLEALIEPGTLSAARAACLDTFRRRQRHSWPPSVNPAASWPQDYALLVAEHPDAPSTLDDAVEYVAQLIERIDSAS